MFNIFAVAITIIIYGIKPIVGFILINLIIIKNLILDKEKNLYNILLKNLIMLIPFMHQGMLTNKNTTFFNYFYIFYIMYFMYIFIMSKGVANKKNATAIIFMLSFACITLFFQEDIIDSFKVVIEYILMIMVLVYTYEYFNRNKKTLEKLKTVDLVSIYLEVVTATAIAMIFSWGMYKFKGIIIGNIMEFGGAIASRRINFNLLFNSYSTLSTYLATGLIISFLNITNNRKKIRNIIQIGLIAIAALLTSARSGIFAAIIVIVFLTLKKIDIKKLFMVIVIIILAANFLLMRGDLNQNSVFYDNGRIELIKENMLLFLKSPVLGIGFHDDSSLFVLPHNFILEYLLQAGVIGFIIFLYLLVELLRFIKNNRYKYVLWCALIANLFFTCLHGQKFTIIFAIILIIDTFKDSYIKEEKDNE